MEAYAALKLKKKQDAQAKSLISISTNDSIRAPPYEEQKKIHQVFGFPEPPNRVFALGKDCKAAVWWFYNDLDSIIGWEVTRYRKDKSRTELHEWSNKGTTKFDTLPRLQVIIDGLTNDYEYRFTIQAINQKGASLESTPSNEIIVEAPLPSGWYRFYDKRKKKHYYASLKTGRSSWIRPELDPFFLADDIFKNFTMEELQNLKGLYVEDMEHFRRISLEQFMDILQEIGEKCSKRWILQLFQAYSSHENKDALVTWQEFINVVNHIKTNRMKPTIINNPFEFINLFYNRAKIRSVLSATRDKMGFWVKEFNTFAGKEYYRHVVTGECSWTVPDEVKFFLSQKFEKRLLKVFDYGQLEEFKQYFSLLDIDNSGDLSEKEIRILLNAMGIVVGEEKLAEMMKAIDVNGNGSVEFDEFCFLMFELCRKDKSGVFKDLKSNKSLSLWDSTKQANHGVLMTVSEEFNFSNLTSAVKGLRGSQIQLDAGSNKHDIQRPPKYSLLLFCCSAGAEVVPEVDNSNQSPKLQRQVSFDAKAQSNIITASSKSKRHSAKVNNEFSDDESDLSGSDDENEDRSIFIRAFSRNSSKNHQGHGAYCMCGCRREL